MNILIATNGSFYAIATIQNIGDTPSNSTSKEGKWPQLWADVQALRSQYPNAKLFAAGSTHDGFFPGIPEGYFKIEYNNPNNVTQGSKLYRKLNEQNSPWVEIQEGHDPDDCTNAFERLQFIYQNGNPDHQEFIHNLRFRFEPNYWIYPQAPWPYTT